MKKFRRILALGLAAALMAAGLTACGGGGDYKTGLAVNANNTSSVSAGDENGKAHSNIDVAAVLLDDKGKIVDVVIDVVQGIAPIDATGQIGIDVSTTFDSKHELGDDYNMRGASPIGAEWFEQAQAMQEWAIGKTAEDLAAVGPDAEGKMADVDGLSGVTITVTGMYNTLVQAVETAEARGAGKGDTLGLGSEVSMGTSKPATADEEGKVQFDGTFAAMTFDKNGKVTSSIFDSTQPAITFDAEGQISSDLEAEVKTKLEKQDEYNMRGASPIGKEWFEQSEAFSEYVKGMTAD